MKTKRIVITVDDRDQRRLQELLDYRLARTKSGAVSAALDLAVRAARRHLKEPSK